MGLIGFFIGVVAFLLKNGAEALTGIRVTIVKYVKKKNSFLSSFNFWM